MFLMALYLYASYIIYKNPIFADISLNILCQEYMIYFSRSLATFFKWPHLNNHWKLNIG